MIDYDEALFDSVSIHKVGSKLDQEGVVVSENDTPISDDKIKETLLNFFFKSFKEPEYYSFDFVDEDFSKNPMYQFASEVFAKPADVHEISIGLAELLYEKSNHPNIKSGDLMVSLIRHVIVDSQMVSALVIIKSETKDAFLQLDYDSGTAEVTIDRGINATKIDKGCIILNTNKSEGYKICIVDKSTRDGEALFWRDGFINIKHRNDSYHKTKELIKLTDHFVKNKLSETHDIDRLDRAQIMNSSSKYFKMHEDFEMEDYENEVFGNPTVIKEFQDYTEQYQEEKDVRVYNKFDVSNPAVKKHSNVFKSVLKLDKNFHVYIHGNREKIERGVDESGRKYYILYYDEEY